MSHPFGRPRHEGANEDDEQIARAQAEMAHPPAPLWVIWLALAVLGVILIATLFVK